MIYPKLTLRQRAALNTFTLALPSGLVRNRYRHEFAGELEALPVGDRAAYLRHVGGSMPSPLGWSAGPGASS
ncbi:hypothetical protein [Nostocoides australiense]